MKECGFTFPLVDIQNLFKYYDKNSNNSVNYQEFILSLQGGDNYSQGRYNSVRTAFEKFDSRSELVVNKNTLTANYNA